MQYRRALGVVGAHGEQEPPYCDAVPVWFEPEVSVHAPEESLDGAGLASCKGGEDAENQDAVVELVGLAAAVSVIDEAEGVGRGGGPAVAEHHPPEVRRVEEDARLPLHAAIARLRYGVQQIASTTGPSERGGGSRETEEVNAAAYVRVGGAVQAVPAEEGDEAAEALPRRGRTSAAPPPRRRRRRHHGGKKRGEEGNGRVVGFAVNQRGLMTIYRWAFPLEHAGSDWIRARLLCLSSEKEKKRFI